MSFLTPEELAQLMPAEMLPHTTRSPHRSSRGRVHSGAQSEKQRQVEARLLDMSDELGRSRG